MKAILPSGDALCSSQVVQRMLHNHKFYPREKSTKHELERKDAPQVFFLSLDTQVTLVLSVHTTLKAQSKIFFFQKTFFQRTSNAVKWENKNYFKILSNLNSQENSQL